MASKTDEEWRRFVHDLACEVDINEVARRLSLHVLPAGSGRGRTLCPFHEDRDPSLMLYPGDRGQAAGFHCFGCGEHGDAYDLVKRLRSLPFPDAVRWLADLQGWTVPVGRPRHERSRVAPKVRGLQLGHQLYLSFGDDARLDAWAKSRSLPADLLRKIGILAVRRNTLRHGWLEPSLREDIDREELDSLVEAGLLRPRPSREQTGSGWLLKLYSEFFYERRILFPLRDLEGHLCGLAGRLDEETSRDARVSRKYLFTPGFKRSEVLFGANRVRQRLERSDDERGRHFHLFVVEGLVDALRLAALDIDAVAILGSGLSEGQAQNVLEKLARLAERRKRVFFLHLYLDMDDAGRKGTRRSLLRLLKMAVDCGFAVDVIAPPDDAGKDPDDQLCKADRTSALASLSSWACPAMAWLVSDLLSIKPSPAAVAAAWQELTPSRRFEIVRQLTWLAPRGEREWWPSILGAADPFATYLDDGSQAAAQPDRPEEWEENVRASLLDFAGRHREAKEHRVSSRVEPLHRSDAARLLLASQLAEASAQRREVPDDPGSWDRIRTAFGAFLPILRARLAQDRSYLFEPMRCMIVPKDDGRIRRKLMPCPEDLVLQQYMLSELLRADGRGTFADHIPAVRYARGETGSRRWTTGAVDAGGNPTTDLSLVSFAYQVDMDILEGRLGASREGMFRPYYECWREYVDYVLARVRRCRAARLYAARLDIRSFYDSVPRYAINDALVPALERAFEKLDDDQREEIARPFSVRDGVREDASALCRRFVDWLCSQVVGAPYLDETSGDVRPADTADRGLAQGPDLSAYLANIVLFRLDGRLREAVGELDAQASAQPGDGTVGGIYARYVDDIILVAPSQGDLRRLRSLIELELARLGLELKPEKTEQLRPMTPRELHGFLVAERGIGRARSGGQEAPPDAPLAHWNDPLASAGDRSEALQYLHDPRLEKAVLADGGTDPAGVRRQIRHALRVPELRHGDRVAAARHIWALAAHQASDGDLANLFIDEWREMPPSRRPPPTEDETENAVQELVPLLVWLDALERFLERRGDRNPTLNYEERQQWAMLRKLVARSVIEGLSNQLKDHWRQQDDANTGQREESLKHLKHLLDSRALALEASAARIVNEHSPHQQWGEPASWSQVRMHISLAAETNSVDLLSNADGWIGVGDERGFLPQLAWLHEAVARLQCWDVDSREDPLLAVAYRAREFATCDRGRDDPAGDALAAVLTAWLPNEDNGEQEKTTQGPIERGQLDVAFALINATGWDPNRFTAILKNRRQLVDWLWENQGVGPPLPTPSALQAPGLLHGPQQSPGYAHRLELVSHPVSDQDISPILEWHKIPPKEGALLGGSGASSPGEDTPVVESTHRAKQGLRRWKSSELNLRRVRCQSPNQPLSASEDATSADLRSALRWVASSFRKLAQIVPSVSTGGESRHLLPTAESLLGPSWDDEFDADSEWWVLSYYFAEKELGNQAFFRPDTNGHRLQARRVQAEYASLWRIGVALADCLGETEIAGEGKRVRATAPGFCTADGDDPDEAIKRWAARSVLRLTLYRLTGSRQPPGELHIAEDSRLPATVDRVLKHVDTFLDDSLPPLAGVAAVLAFGAESEALELLATTDFPLDAPGAPAWLLAQATHSLLGRMHGLTDMLPEIIEAREPNGGLRRSVRAWRQIAWRIEALGDLADNEEVRENIRPVVAGLCLHTLGVQLRAQALEQWGGVSPDARRKTVDDPPTLAVWGLDERCLVLATTPVEEPEGQVEPALARLFAELTDATAPGAVGGWDILARITPLGWLVVMGVAMRHGRAAAERPTDAEGEADWLVHQEEAREKVVKLAQTLAAEPDSADDRAWWERVSSSIELSVAGLDGWLEVLAGVDSWLGTTVRTVSSGHHPLRRSSVDERNRFDFESSLDGRAHRIEQWQVQAAALGAEPGAVLEHVDRPGGNLEYTWTETWRGQRLLGVSLVRPALASLALLQPLRDGAEASQADHVDRSAHPAPRSAEPETPPEPPGEPEPIQPSSPPAAESAEPRIPPDPPGEPEPIHPPSPPALRSDAEAYRALKLIQRKVWQDRGRAAEQDSLGSVRVALFQWDLDHSYFSPVLTDLCGDDGEARKRHVRDVIPALRASAELPCRRLQLRRSEHEWTERHQDFSAAASTRMPSCAEYRRRQLLSAVLEACDALQVQVLLLPEYSVRWDTLAWLLEHGLPDYAPRLSVWAGTYLRAHGTPPLADLPNQLGSPPVDPPEWSAVLSAIIPTDEGRVVLARGKKYPAIALNEEFLPSTDPLRPLFDLSTDRQEPLSFVTELICSEVFIAMSPANWVPVVAACRALLHRHVLQDEAVFSSDTLHKDMKILSFDLAMTNPVRRSLVLVPALTKRATDYQIFAQANYLAAGITTVFCNAVIPGASIGQSCFIGHGGWDLDSHGLPPPSPYHDPLPGIFAQSRNPRGCLGKREQALVVADVDPRYALEGRPRPQGLPLPLRLVAHLPVLESWHRRKDNAPHHWCRCLSSDRQDQHWAEGGKIHTLVRDVVAACQRLPRPENTGMDPDFSGTVRILNRLADAIPDSPGLRERAKAYLQNHRSRPQSWPPPALVDWLCVDPGAPEDWMEDTPVVDVWMPPFRDVVKPGTDGDKEPGE